MQVNAYLLFDGRCEEAFRFYEKCFNGKIVAMLTHKGTPAEQHVPAKWVDKILHARLDIGDQVLMASDTPPDRYEKPAGFSVSLQVKTPAEAERLFKALAEKGEIRMPLEKTF